MMKSLGRGECNELLPWHSLVAVRSKVIEHDSNFHALVSHKAIIVSKEHDLVLVSQPVVGDRNTGRSSSDIKETIMTLIKCIVIYPNLCCCDQPNCISINMS